MQDFSQYELQPFLDFLKFEKRYSEHTLISYQTDLNDFFAFLDRSYGNLKMEEIRSAYVRSWLAELKARKLAARSINRKISSLRSYFKYHLKRGTIQLLPTSNISAQKQGKRLPVFVKESETKELLEAMSRSTEDWKSYNGRMLVNLFYATGMRLSELINLKEKQLDLGRSQVKVLGKGNKERIIPVSPEIVELIRDYQALKRKEFGAGEQQPETLLVTEKGRKMYAKYAYLLVNKYLGQASTLDKKSPHVLRHSFATHLMNHGADLNAVKELLGHSSLAATQVYTHNSIEKLKDAHKKAHPKA